MAAQGSFGAPGENVARGGEGSAYQDTVLGDGRVTRAELEESYIRLFDCFRSHGAEGEIWIALDVGPSYAARLRIPHEGGVPDGDLGFIGACEEEYVSHVQRAYREQLPAGSDDRPELLELAKACLRDRLPDVFEEVKEESTMTALRLAVFDLTPDVNSAQVADECVVYYGIPWQLLESATPG